jgi:putative colanic acid biosynthesis UDP-glucose lipid carrier transferase
MNQNFSRLLRGLFAFLDLIVLNTLFFFTKYLFVNVIVDASNAYLVFCIFCNISWLFSSWLYSIYQGKYITSFEVFVRRTMHAFILFMIAVLLYLYFTRQVHISRSFSSTFLISFPLCLMINRLLYLITYFYFKQKDYLIKRVLIIGHNEVAKKLTTYLETQGPNMQIVGFCEEDSKMLELSHYPILGSPAEALETSSEHKVNEIYSTILPEQDNCIYGLMEAADRACIRFKLVPDLAYFVKRPMHVSYLSDIAVLSPRTEPLDDLANRIKKRIFDIVISTLVILLVLSWLVPLISFLIWLESGWPVFFIQKRSGVNNKPFNCIKFRSMKINKEANTSQAKREDDRFTKIGRILRKTNLDEFPQFFNVWMGSMSIVGPRPHMLRHTVDYSMMYDQYMIRQFLKPGITGWAQVHGFRGEINSVSDIRNRVEHDLWYMENWNHWLDMKIIFLTAYNMIRGEENAY